MSETADENKTNVRVVRHVDRPVLGSEETNLVPLPITDDRDTDYIDPRLIRDADLVITVEPSWAARKFARASHAVKEMIESDGARR